MTGRALSNVKRPAEPWRQRLIRSLLYGRNVDRAAKARARVGLAILLFAAIYVVLAGRLVMFAVGADSHGARRGGSQDAIATARPDIVDRNGEVLATDVKAPSLFGEPRRIIDKDEAIELLTAALPDLDEAEARTRLSSRKGFVWLKREITPKQQRDIHKLGIPGIGFLRENKRVYPTGASVAHLIGLVNIDNQGIAGMEKWLDNNGLADLHRAGFATDRLQKPVELSIDLRVEHALRDELLKAKEKYKAKAASGLVSNVRTGEIVALVSLPDFDPNNPKEAHDPDRINRLTTGVFEMGSTFKALTLAMALDSGKATLNTLYDGRGVLKFGKFTIHDTHPVGRNITLSEVFTFSSNVGAAKIALAQGVEAHKAFLKKLGQMDRLRTELPESASPIVPKRWTELNTITASFGHGIAVAPLRAVMGISALVNGGYLLPPTFMKRSEDEARALARRVVKSETSDKMRYLMRLNAE
jgi:cell division protein FtsI (penicillin-binding protein 3)